MIVLPTIAALSGLDLLLNDSKEKPQIVEPDLTKHNTEPPQTSGNGFGDLTRDFSLSDFKCHDGSPVPPQYVDNCKLLAHNLQVLKDHTSCKIVIVSGYRSPAHNASVDGAEQSQHMFAKAADIRLSGKTPKEVCGIVKRLVASGAMTQGGIGLYAGWVHYDVRGHAARWGGA